MAATSSRSNRARPNTTQRGGSQNGVQKSKARATRRNQANSTKPTQPQSTTRRSNTRRNAPNTSSSQTTLSTVLANQSSNNGRGDLRESASRSPDPPIRGKKIDSILWLMYPDDPAPDGNILNSTTGSLGLSMTECEAYRDEIYAEVPGMMKRFDHKYIGGYAYEKDVLGVDLRIDQSIAMALQLRYMINNNPSIQLEKYEDFDNNLVYENFSKYLHAYRKTLIIITWCGTIPQNTEKLFNELHRRQQRREENFTVYPNSDEIYQYLHKTRDSQDLDYIAGKSEHKYAYRPVSCYGTSRCKLMSHSKTIHKKSHSNGGSDVEARDQSENERYLTCYRVRQNSGMKRQFWFHQEIVSSLKTFGEFRVFIVAKPDPLGLRGRRLEVFKMVHTMWYGEDNKTLVAREVTDEQFEWVEAQTLSPEDVEDFALYTANEIRKLDDALRNWESLDICGIRLDIGISDEPGKHGKYRLFVLEATRAFDASMFAEQVWPQPHYQPFRIYMEALKSYFKLGIEYDTMREDDDGDGDDSMSGRSSDDEEDEVEQENGAGQESEEEVDTENQENGGDDEDDEEEEYVEMPKPTRKSRRP